MKTKNKIVELGEVWVDSGTLVIGDPCYVLNIDKDNPGDIKRTDGVVTFPSGYGDGVYTVCGEINKEGRVISIFVDLDPYGVSKKSS
jgi:hypothetical protein